MFLVLMLFVALTIVLHGTEAVWPMLTTPRVAATASFFVASLGLLAGLAQIVFPSARQDLAQLTRLSTLPSDSLCAMSDALERLPRRSALMALPPALGLAAGHIWLLGPSSPHLGPQWAGNICNVLLWVAMFQISVPLINNARLFSLLGRCTTVNLYQPGELTAFGRAAIRPCLFIIALQCAYVLLMLPDDARFAVGTAVGLMVSMVLVAALFFLPLRGIRSRIRSRRRQVIAALDARLARLPQADDRAADSASLAEVESLLALRARMAAVSAWPLGLEGVRRLLFYLVLVPLTWVGAALVEMLLEARL
ncbi:MAG: hypothetical protein JJT88_10335 [Gammaproteobacteria bacterium]|nr:hypothetical protein [Gammaproteobacteria bacterium]